MRGSKLISLLKGNGFHIEKEPVALDIICGMELKIKHIKYWLEYKGQTYYFCSSNCKDHFKNDPKMYLGE